MRESFLHFDTKSVFITFQHHGRLCKRHCKYKVLDVSQFGTTFHVFPNMKNWFQEGPSGKTLKQVWISGSESCLCSFVKVNVAWLSFVTERSLGGGAASHTFKCTQECGVVFGRCWKKTHL